MEDDGQVYEVEDWDQADNGEGAEYDEEEEVMGEGEEEGGQTNMRSTSHFQGDGLPNYQLQNLHQPTITD